MSDRLGAISKQEWENLRQKSIPFAKERGFYELDWYNLRYVPRAQEPPDDRDSFHISGGRFAIPERKVTYLAAGPHIAMMELKARNEEYADSIIDDWAAGRFVPNLDKQGHNLTLRIVGGSAILDLSVPNSPFFKLVDRNETGFLSGIIGSRDESVYPDTHLISLHAFEHGFDGLAWNSVRYRLKKTREQAQVLVIYKRSAVEPWI